MSFSFQYRMSERLGWALWSALMPHSLPAHICPFCTRSSLADAFRIQSPTSLSRTDNIMTTKNKTKKQCRKSPCEKETIQKERNTKLSSTKVGFFRLWHTLKSQNHKKEKKKKSLISDNYRKIPTPASPRSLCLCLSHSSERQQQQQKKKEGPRDPETLCASAP